MSGQRFDAGKIFFYLAILFLPTQLGRHFWPAWSYVLGIRVDYLSPTVYLTDIFIGLLFIVWSISYLKLLFSGRKRYDLRFKIKKYWPYIVLGLTVLIGIVFAKDSMAGWYGLLKLSEFIFFGFYTALNIGKKIKFDNIRWLLLPGLVFESVLSILQFINQGSLGGIFYFFGERTFNGQTPGIANASLSGELILRPYGTFPHPNVLAGYLIVAMTIILSAISVRIGEKFTIKKILFFLSVIAGTASLFLTMSRVAIVLWFVVFLIWLANSLPFALFPVCLLLFAVLFFSPIGYRFANIGLGSQAVVQRENLIAAALLMFRKNFLLGTGLNNFLPVLPGLEKQNTSVLYLQPVHNIYLLTASETGIAGFLFLLWFIVKTCLGILREKPQAGGEKSIMHNSKLILLSAILILGFFDHYFFTLQQGQLLSSFVFGLIWSKIKL